MLYHWQLELGTWLSHCTNPGPIVGAFRLLGAGTRQLFCPVYCVLILI